MLVLVLGLDATCEWVQIHLFTIAAAKHAGHELRYESKLAAEHCVLMYIYCPLGQ